MPLFCLRWSLAMIPSLLTRHFGFDRLRPGQEAVISRLLDGKSAAAIFPTGAGKSLCYQLPSLALPHLTLVISPLIALMHDQLAFLQRKGIAAATLDSSQTPEESRRVMQQASDGQLKILMISVERLKNERFRRFIAQLPLSMLVVDEAHCISEWGHNFRPDYLKLPAHRLELNIPQVLLLTATATPAVMADMQAKFGIDKEDLVVTGFYRANLDLGVIPLAGSARDAWLQDELRRDPAAPTIVYVTLQHTAQQCAELLQRAGIRACAYHAGLDPALRSQIQHDFMAGKLDCIVATIAFGMGIDKPDVRFVAHTDLPKSMEGYYQETGRAGRDGEAAEAWLCYGLGDVVLLKQMIEQSEAGEERKQLERGKLDHLLGYCESMQCRRQVLLAGFGETYPQPCGNCDNCLTPPASWDATIPAQKALSCVYRTGQRFGVGHLIDVLRGSENEKVKQQGHDKLSTYAIGRDLDARTWRSVFRQLVAASLLEVDSEGHGGLRLTDASRDVLTGRRQISMRRDPASSTSGRERSAQRTGLSVLPQDLALFNALRGLRAELAREQNVPAFVIFHDSTLRNIAEQRPTSLDELARVGGIGGTKLSRYGPRLVEIVREEG